MTNTIPSEGITRAAIQEFETATARGVDHYSAMQYAESGMTVRILRGRINFARAAAITYALHRDSNLTLAELNVMIAGYDERKAPNHTDGSGV